MTASASGIRQRLVSARTALAPSGAAWMRAMLVRRTSPRARLAHYGFALAIVALALGARELFGPATLGFQFITFFPAVALSAVVGGFGPGMLSTALSTLLAGWFYMPPYGAMPRAVDAAMVAPSLAFFLDQILVCAAIEAMHRYYRYFHQANKRLAEQRALLHAIVEGTTDPIFVKDAAGRYLHCNGAYARLVGMPAAALIGRDAGALFPPRTVQMLARHDAAVLAAGQVCTVEEVIVAADGSERSFHTTKGPLFDQHGKLTGLFGIGRDLTERQRIEAERQREHALLTGVMKATDVLLAYLDCDFNFVWVNQAYADNFRHAPAAMIGKNHFALYPDANHEALFCRVRDSGQPAYHKDKPCEFPDQPERGVTYWDWSVAPDLDGTGGARGLVFSLRETTLQVRARQAVQESEQRFAAMADAAPVLIWLSGPDQRCTWFNRHWLRFTGRTLEQEIDHGWAEGLHPDDRAHCLHVYHSSAARRQPFKMDYRLRSASGHYRWLTDQAAPRYSADGVFLGYVGACADVTERRLAEDALRENERKLKLFIESVPAGIAMFDRAMRYLAVSRRFLDDYRIADQDVIGRCHYDIFPEIPARWREIHRRCLAGETHHCAEDAFARDDGSVRWLHWEVRPWQTTHGAIGGIILFTENISARKQAEDALRVAKAEAERANEAKSRFLAAASHDLRQPLSALSLYVGVLKHKLAPADAPLLSNMVNCVANLNELLEDLLDVSKLDAGVVRPEISDFSVADLLASLAAVHAPEALLKGLRYRPVLSNRHARSDPVLYRRILGNLIANAVRYTERGGVLVGCRRHQGKIWIEVWDSGIGIAPDQIGTIFEEFRQLDNNARNRGSGLGLAIAAKASALLGLQIRVRSRPGKGSMFAIELPVGAAAEPAVPSAPRQRALRVGVVDDNAGVLGALACALETMGHQVVAAAAAADLLLLLAGAAPDVVISDFRLGNGETGFNVIAAARAAFGAQLPALLITGDTDPDLIRAMSERGILVQHKPLEPDTLQSALDRLTNHLPA